MVDKTEKTVNYLQEYLALDGEGSKHLADRDNSIVEDIAGRQYNFKINGVITVSPDMLIGDIGTIARKMKLEHMKPNFINLKKRNRKIRKQTMGSTGDMTIIESGESLPRWAPQRWTPFVCQPPCTYTVGSITHDLDAAYVIQNRHMFYGGYYVDPYVASALVHYVFGTNHWKEQDMHTGTMFEITKDGAFAKKNSTSQASVSIGTITETMQHILGTDDITQNYNSKNEQTSITGGEGKVRDEFVAYLKSLNAHEPPPKALSQLLVREYDFGKENATHVKNVCADSISKASEKKLITAVRSGNGELITATTASISKRHGGELPAACLAIIANATGLVKSPRVKKTSSKQSGKSSMANAPRSTTSALVPNDGGDADTHARTSRLDDGGDDMGAMVQAMYARSLK